MAFDYKDGRLSGGHKISAEERKQDTLYHVTGGREGKDADVWK
jgi:hypothetical protein